MIVRAEIRPMITWLDKKGDFENQMMQVRPEDIDAIKRGKKNPRCFWERNGVLEIPIPTGEIIKIRF